MRDLTALKVCFVAGTLGLGGAERQLFYLVTGLRSAGARARVLCLTHREHWEDELRERGVPVTWVGQGESRLGRLRRIIAELRRDPPNVLQSHHFYTNLYVVGAARVLGVREIGAIRNDARSEVDFTGRLGMLSLRAPKLLAANSRAGLENAVALGVPRRRLQLLPNVVDTEQFEPPRLRQNGAVRLLAIGLRVEKQIERFLSVVNRLRRGSGRPIEAIVIGEGPDRGRYETLAAELGLLPNGVAFKGAVPVTAHEYAAADIFVLTSAYEGTPNVLLEAMSSGLPVVAFRTGGVPEVVQHGQTGYLTEMNDEESMTAALRKLVDHPEQRARMGAQGRAFVRTKYGIDRLPQILSDFYGAALA